jgi:hypothetical protein
MKELMSKQGILVITTGGLVLFGLIIWLLFGQTQPATDNRVQTKLPEQLPRIELAASTTGDVTFQDIQISGEIPSTPPEMLVFVEETQDVSTVYLNKLGQDFGFRTPAELLAVANLYTWKNETSRMTYNRLTSELTYSKDVISSNNFAEARNATELQKIVTNFLIDRGIPNTQYQKIDNISYLKMYSGEAEVVDDYSKGNIAVVNLIPSLDGYDIYSQNGSIPKATAWIGTDGEIIKLNIRLSKFVSSQKTVPVIPISQVIGRLANGQGKVVSINNEGFDAQRRKSFVKLVISKFAVGYFVNQTSQVALPIFAIQGKAFGVDDREGSDLVIYVEAPNYDR